MAGRELPIDIHLDKFIEWLESRDKIVKKQWQTDLMGIQSRIKQAVPTLPEKLRDIFQNTAIDYWTGKRVLTMLVQAKEASGAHKKTMFGNYSDAELKNWDEIIRAYEKNNIYLGESARILTRNVNNDIPGLRRQLETADRQISDLQRRHKDNLQSSARFLKQYNEACTRLGVTEGVELREGIDACKQRLTPALRGVEAHIQSNGVQHAIEFYRSFACYTLKSSFTHMDEEAHRTSLLPTASKICRGDECDLSDTDTRQNLVSDLVELTTFLEQRLADFKASPAFVLPDAPDALKMQSESQLENYLATANSSVAMLKDSALQQLIMLNKSERYVDRTVDKVSQNLRHSQRLQKTADEQQAKRKALLRSIQEDKQKLAELTKGTKELKLLVEGAVSAMFDGRKVNLFGDIASL